MKKFSILAAFVFAVMISSTALAANWVLIETLNSDDVVSKTYVDKDSIKRGIHSEKLNFSREDGFSVVVKTVFEFKDKKNPLTMIMSVGLFEENGAKKYCVFEISDEKGSVTPGSSDKLEISNADGSDGTIWPAVWDYVQKNLP
ncbi:MAG: hypothetical protein IJ774_13700 [Selenomonadaceae bacterium]|nr:hypothetical protein [Selenomonadaceae bacterium]